MRNELVIRPPVAGDREPWERLWQGYLRFYRAHLEPTVTDTTWARLLDPAEQPHGLVAEHDGRLVGLVHYLFHRSSWTVADYCYLQDLFVDGEARGHGAGRKLIEAVYAAADAAGASRVYWLTQEFNADGRALYDTLARRTSFIVYRR
jgi:GNAT superfamily N-acetyltransferase